MSKRSKNALDLLARQTAATRAWIALTLPALPGLDWLERVRETHRARLAPTRNPRSTELETAAAAELTTAASAEAPLVGALLRDPAYDVAALAWASKAGEGRALDPEPTAAVAFRFARAPSRDIALSADAAEVPLIWSMAWALDPRATLTWLQELGNGGGPRARGKVDVKRLASALEGIARMLAPGTAEPDLCAFVGEFLLHWEASYGWLSLATRLPPMAPNALLAAVRCAEGREAALQHPGLADRMTQLFAEPLASAFERAAAARLLLSWGRPLPPGRLSPAGRILVHDARVDVHRAETDVLEKIAADQHASPFARIRALGEAQGLLAPSVPASRPNPPTKTDDELRRELARLLCLAEQELDDWSRTCEDATSRVEAVERALRVVLSQLPLPTWRLRSLGGWPVVPGAQEEPERSRVLDLAARLRELGVEAMHERSTGETRRLRRLLLEAEPHLRTRCARSLPCIIVSRRFGGDGKLTLRRAMRRAIESLQQLPATDQLAELQALQRLIAAEEGEPAANEAMRLVHENATSPTLRINALHAVTGLRISLSCGAEAYCREGEPVSLRVFALRATTPGEPWRPAEDVEVRVSVKGQRLFQGAATDTSGVARVSIGARSGEGVLRHGDVVRVEARRGDVLQAGSEAVVRVVRCAIDAKDIGDEWRDILGAALGSREAAVAGASIGAGQSGAQVRPVTCRAPYAPLIAKLGPAPALRSEFARYRDVIAPSVPSLTWGALPPIVSGARGVLVYNLVEAAAPLADVVDDDQRRRAAVDALDQLLEMIESRWWPAGHVAVRDVPLERLHPDETIGEWEIQLDGVELARPADAASDQATFKRFACGEVDATTLLVAGVSAKALKLHPLDAPHLRIRLAPRSADGGVLGMLERFPEIEPGALVGLNRTSRATIRRLRSTTLGGDAPLYERLVSTPFGWPVATIHGDFHARNILVSDRGPVLIDFAHALREGCPYFDLAKLELYLRLWSRHGTRGFEPLEEQIEAARARRTGAGRTAPAVVALVRRVRAAATRLERTLGATKTPARYDHALAAVGLTMNRFDDSRQPGDAWRRFATGRAIARLQTR